MTISPNLMNALLALDSYNRDYNSGIILTGSSIGSATIILQSSVLLDESEVRLDIPAGFYGVAYQYNGEVIVSYRGTDQILTAGGIGGDAENGFLVGGGITNVPQANLAIDFYKAVDTATSLDISLTGHSLGGGLAGFVGALYDKEGVLFDNMPFELAADETYSLALGYWTEDDPPVFVHDSDLQTRIYGEETPWAPTYPGDMTAFALEDEFLSWLRVGQETVVVQYELGDEVNIVPGLDWGLTGGGLHSMAALVIRMFAEETEVTSSHWEKSAKYFWPIMYEDGFAEQMGITGASVAGADNSATKMRSMIAYSALDGNEEGSVTIFGDTGIRALYNDANELGALLSDPDVSSAITDFASNISYVFVEYAGDLAKNKISQSTSSSFEATEGILAIDSGLLTVDFSDDKWMMGTDGLPSMASREMFMDGLSDTLSSGQIRSGMRQVYGTDSAAMIEKVSFVISLSGVTATLGSPSAEERAQVLISEQNGLGHIDEITGSSGSDIVLTGYDDDTVYGYAGNDVIDGGDGDDLIYGDEDNDALIGGTGTDTLEGGAGNDVLYFGTSLSEANGVFSDETYDGGTGYDVLDFKGFEHGLDYVIDDSSISISEYNGSPTDIRTDLTIDNIEGFNLTDHDDRLEITDGTTGVISETHSGNDIVLAYGDSNTIAAGEGSDRFIVTGSSNILHGDGGGDLVNVESGANYNTIYGGTGADEFDIDGGGNTLDAGAGDDKIFLDGIANTAFMGDGDDTIIVGGSGNVIYSGDGDDSVEVTGLLEGIGQALLADAGLSDRISAYSSVLSGGFKNISQETQWVTSGLVKYGVNQQGELVIGSSFFGGELFVSSYVNTLNINTSTAGITLGVYAGGAYAIYRDVVNYPYGLTLKMTIDNLPQTIKFLAQQANPQYDPIILDLDADGVETTTVSSIAPMYDFNLDGFAERAGWVHSDDGFLAIDADLDGKITADEMFGSATVSGFDALEALDDNTDGKVDVSDDAFADLVVWRDLDQDAVTDEGELFTLADLDIKSINVTPDSTTPETQAGNTIAAAGTFTYDDDTTGETGEVHFNTTPYYSTWLEDVELTLEAQALPDLQGHGTIAGLRLSMSYDEDLITTVEDVLTDLDTTDLSAMRDALLPLLQDWMDAIPVPGGTPGTTTRSDVPVFATSDPLSGAQIEDYGIRVTDGSGTYWIRASGDDVLDEFDDPIERPSYEDLIAQNIGYLDTARILEIRR